MTATTAASSVMFGIGPKLPLASCVSKGEMTPTGRPFDSTSAQPDAMLSIPNVAMKSLILPFEMTMPLMMPNIMPVTTAITMPIGTPHFWVTEMPIITQDICTSDPTERSMPAVMMTKV